MAVDVEALDRDPLQRRPAVRSIPLLAGAGGGRGESVRLQEPVAHGRRDRAGLLGCRDTEEERIERRRAQVAGQAAFPPGIVAVHALFRVPQVAVHRETPLPRAGAELRGSFWLTGQAIRTRKRLLQRVEQTVQVHRHDLDGPDRLERAPVREPARAEIPAALSGRAQIPVHLRGWTTRLARGLDVLAVALLARCVPVVPVPIEERPVVQAHHAPVRAALRERGGTLHPEVVLARELRQVFPVHAVALARCDQVDHRREERRLRAAEIISAIAVRDVAVTIDQEGEVPHHVDGEVVASALLETEHREIGIPVVDLAEAPARNHVAIGQRQKRGVRRGLNGRPFEHCPQLVDVRLDIDAGRANGTRSGARPGRRSAPSRTRAGRSRGRRVRAAYSSRMASGLVRGTASTKVLPSS